MIPDMYMVLSDDDVETKEVVMEKKSLKVGDRVRFHGRKAWWTPSFRDSAKDGEEAIVERIDESHNHTDFQIVTLMHLSRAAGFDRSDGNRGHLFDCADVVPANVCKRPGCTEPLAYSGAEYCGASCSEQRKEPKSVDWDAFLPKGVTLTPGGILMSKRRTGQIYASRWSDTADCARVWRITEQGDEVMAGMSKGNTFARGGLYSKERASLSYKNAILVFDVMKESEPGPRQVSEKVSDTDMDVVSAYSPKRRWMESGPGIENLFAKQPEPRWKPVVDEWDLLPDVDVRR